MSTKTKAEKKRSDQFQCPACGRWGCPPSNGSRVTGLRILRYRRCSHCSHAFRTVSRKRIDGSYSADEVG